MHRLDRFIVSLTREQGAWESALSREQTAYALAQVSASRVLPSLIDLGTGSALLDYHVSLRDCLDTVLVLELVSVLDDYGQDLHWEQIEATLYAGVIGAGVAACIDTTPEHECLYFRYANALEIQLNNAHRAAELPRSVLFLQSALFERFDTLLDYVRARTWYWLLG